jgi:hypothetical protein
MHKYILVMEKTQVKRRVSHYLIVQSMTSICDMKKMFGGEAKHNPRVST